MYRRIVGKAIGKHLERGKSGRNTKGFVYFSVSTRRISNSTPGNLSRPNPSPIATIWRHQGNLCAPQSIVAPRVFFLSFFFFFLPRDFTTPYVAPRDPWSFVNYRPLCNPVSRLIGVKGFAFSCGGAFIFKRLLFFLSYSIILSPSGESTIRDKCKFTEGRKKIIEHLRETSFFLKTFVFRN